MIAGLHTPPHPPHLLLLLLLTIPTNMGNNTSTTRKSAASVRHLAAFRKSSQSQSNSNNLEEEFSDLILHEVKRQKQQLLEAEAAPNGGTNSTPGGHVPLAAEGPQFTHHDKFTQDLIEDEFNELNDGLLDNDASEVSRSILPDDHMDVDAAQRPVVAVTVDEMDASSDLLNDLTKVDFTRIAVQLQARQPVSRLPSSIGQGSGAVEAGKGLFSELIPVEIKWVNSNRENIGKVAIIGSFSQWRDVIKLKRSATHPNEYSTTVKLALGVHKLLYIVNNEYRVLEQLPTATDQEGIFFNWFEVLDPHRLFNHLANQQTHADATTPFDANIIQVAGQHDTLVIQRKLNSFLAKVTFLEKGPSHEHIEDAEYLTYHTQALLSFIEGSLELPHVYLSEIPEMFVNYDYFKNKSADYELPEPPQLPAHLNNVLLNKMLSNQQQNHAQNFAQVSDPLFKRPPLRRADSLYYASNKEAYHLLIPNHVILNHLMTTLIRNDVLTVACITRYLGKFVTQIMHLPADTNN